MSINGIGIAKDSAKAVEWFQKAAEQGDADSQNSLGYCLHNGIGIAKDAAKAVEWFQKAAEQGQAPANTVWVIVYTTASE